MAGTIRVTIWNERRHEQHDPAVSAVYPDGIHGAIARGLQAPDFSIKTALLDDPDHGLGESMLSETDVLIWWGHIAHEEVREEVVERVHQCVLSGMGLIALHSAHQSKIFRRLMGTSCNLKWREAGERERLWVVAPEHPIAAGLPEYIELQPEEMYGEPFDIPPPETLVLISWFQGGEVFRSGCCYRRGLGRIFYFRPGHETYPTFHNREVQRIIRNGIHWAAPGKKAQIKFGESKPPEPLT